MSTIAQTLNQIQELQSEIKKSGVESWFVRELMNFTSVVFFQYLSHVVLEESKERLGSLSQKAAKYYELAGQPELFDEFTRFSNMGQFTCIWNAYEKYLRQKYLVDYGSTKNKLINELFLDLIRRAEPLGSEKMKEEFEVMRSTRNSLHDGGVVRKSNSPCSGKFFGAAYRFYPGEPVTPLRVVEVAFVMWRHYQAFEAVSNP
ncbi:hypothetical protein [Marinobacter psychrophilus]|uniref:hypothetical protein n=1 Tax=Marinobacter psychrophilus TaxID=330734 RepID=UPI001B5111EA|nr:hypothetical protein [Marinobacter psychrophilus]MBQ0764016.1 hypothetical protein [Marinobacter psychrophilus]MBQ0843906.1 hypothetical protein [Marinobacter psychrophilus]